MAARIVWSIAFLIIPFLGTPVSVSAQVDAPPAARAAASGAWATPPADPAAEIRPALPPQRSVLGAATLSLFVMPGLGQLYSREPRGKVLLHFGLGLATAALAATSFGCAYRVDTFEDGRPVTSTDTSECIPGYIGIVSGTLFRFWSGWDAARSAFAFNTRHREPFGLEPGPRLRLAAAGRGTGHDPSLRLEIEYARIRF